MTDLNSLMIFAKVVEAKSFSEAARLLKMPTSTVSRRVADLEDELGVRLLERSTRSLRLTDVGSELLEHARHTVELNEAVDNIASNHLSNVSGELRLSAPPNISDSLLAPLIGAFQASYPKVRVQVFITDRIVDQIAEGVDLAFKIGEQLKDSSLVARRILTYHHQLVASRAIWQSASGLKNRKTYWNIGHWCSPFGLRQNRGTSFARTGRKRKRWCSNLSWR
jgi:DNA-binding transcriptional LysR family regulator